MESVAHEHEALGRGARPCRRSGMHGVGGHGSAPSRGVMPAKAGHPVTRDPCDTESSGLRSPLSRGRRQRQPPSVPLVDGTSPAARGSIATAARSARARPLKQNSAIWWSLRAVERLDVQRHAGVHRERLEPLLHQLGVERADLVARELGLEHEKRPARNVDRHARQRLVHRHVHVGVARDALHVAERLLHRLAERDADVLGRVVLVDVQVALRLDA